MAIGSEREAEGRDQPSRVRLDEHVDERSGPAIEAQHRVGAAARDVDEAVRRADLEAGRRRKHRSGAGQIAECRAAPIESRHPIAGAARHVDHAVAIDPNVVAVEHRGPLRDRGERSGHRVEAPRRAIRGMGRDPAVQCPVERREVDLAVAVAVLAGVEDPVAI